MSQFNTRIGEEVSETNRHCWRIPKGLPIDSEIVKMQFILHNKIWEYEAYYTYDKIFRFTVNTFQVQNNHSYRICNVRGGIVGDDQKELVVLKAGYYEKNGRIYFVIHNFVLRSELYDMMQTNKVLYIFIQMEKKKIEKPQFVQQIAARTQKVETDFKEMLLTGKNSDVTIQVKRKKFKCHQCVLSARSPVFSAMMEHDMKEKASGVVTIKDAEPTTFQEFLLYVYTGSKEHLTCKNVTGLYKLGDKYGVEDLKSLCVTHMNENITMVNFYDFFLLSLQHSDSELKTATINFFFKYSKEIVESKSWMVFLSRHPLECNVLITALASK